MRICACVQGYTWDLGVAQTALLLWHFSAGRVAQVTWPQRSSVWFAGGGVGPSRLFSCVNQINGVPGLAGRPPKHRSEGREPESWSAGRQWSGRHWVKSWELKGHWLVAGGGWVVREKNGQTEGKQKITNETKGHKRKKIEKEISFR